MKPIRRILSATMALALCVAPPKHAGAEDIDLFTQSSGGGVNPNILVIIDNSANWSAASQHWPGGVKQGQSELKALRTVVNEIRPTDATSSKVNLGLMMFTGGQGQDIDGGYIRFHVRPMTQTNVDALAELIGNPASSSCSGTNTLTGSPNCIYHNFDTPFEKTATADTDYSAALFEAYKYFGGFTDPANAQLDVAGVPPSGATTPHTFTSADSGAAKRRAGTVPSSTSDNEYKKFDPEAYTDSTKSRYVSPITTDPLTGLACAKNYIIFIGNGFPTSEPTAYDTELLYYVNSPQCTNASTCQQLSMPQFSTTSSTVTSTFTGDFCGNGNNATQRKNDCEANIPQSFKDANPADTYTCVNPRVNTSPCNGANKALFDVETSKTVITVTPTGTFATPASSKIRFADEWAKYLYTTDVNAAAGQQNVAVYTIDVFKDAQDADQTALLSSMAKYGGGKYFQATSEQAIIDALRQILIEIQSVNTVFASASLPINATNRSQNENQVFIGMFRPDGGARPRWYGNLKRYQIALFSGEAKLADATCDATQVNPSPPCVEAVSATTGFLTPCARSFWTSDTGPYWEFSPLSAGQCTTAGFSLFSDKPDGAQVEKGAVAEVLRLGNNPPSGGYADLNAPGATSPVKPASTIGVSRTIYTCTTTSDCKCLTASAPGCGATAGAMDAFNATNVSQAQVNAADSTEHTNIINFTRGEDIGAPLPDDNTNLATTDVRPSVHGDVAHSRPLPVNYGGGTGVVLYYGSNDGFFRAVRGSDGKELWAFVAPEHHGANNSNDSRLKRLRDNSPLIFYPGSTIPGAIPKHYFFDGSAGLFQNADNTRVWIFPSQRRGGRMLYAFDVTTPTSPRMKWRLGCPNLGNDSGCTTGFNQIGQTWSVPAVALVKGFSTTEPVIIMGGGYDSCEDADSASPTCGGTKGNRAYVINADTGALIREFSTDRAVPGDITLVDRDFDGYADHGYLVDSGGGLYRIDFVDPVTLATLSSASWTITKIATTNVTPAGRKFLFAPSTLPTSGAVFVAFGSGDREQPLITDYPYTTTDLPAAGDLGIKNRFYMFKDTFATSGLPVNLDDESKMTNVTTDTGCGQSLTTGTTGWFFDLTAGRGEQVVTSSTIFGGLIFFSTNRPLAGAAGSCTNNLGEARGYAVNLLNGSGAVGTEQLCGGTRSGVFVGGGLPPSPVTGTVPVGGRPVTVMIGGVQRSGGASSPIGAQKVKPAITQKRSRIYWYTQGNK